MADGLMVGDTKALALAHELAALMGESVDDAVVHALEERLKREREIKEKLDRVLALATELRSHIKGDVSSADHARIYSDDGLTE